MSDLQKYEKQEKEEKDEKELDKREEKTMEEKWHRDPLGSMIWALILIWAGLVWLGWNFGVLERYAFLNRFLSNTGDIQPPIWALIFLGAGVLILIEVLIRLVVPAYRRSVIGSIIVAAIFLGIGLGDLVRWNIIWPVVIITIGLVIILQGLLRRK
jgi:hypothetical protein